MKTFALILVFISAIIGLAHAQTQVFERYEPSSTSVAIMPVINRSGEKVPEDRAKQARFGSEELVKRFTESGFKLISSAKINEAITVQKLDLDDEENYRKTEFYKIGKATGAQLLIFVVIDAVDQRDVHKVFVQSKVAKANIRIWFLDVSSEKPLLNGVRQEASSEGGGMFPAFEKGSARMPIAVANAVRKALEPFLKQYKPVKK